MFQFRVTLLCHLNESFVPVKYFFDCLPVVRVKENCSFPVSKTPKHEFLICFRKGETALHSLIVTASVFKWLLQSVLFCNGTA